MVLCFFNKIIIVNKVIEFKIKFIISKFKIFNLEIKMWRKIVSKDYLKNISNNLSNKIALNSIYSKFNLFNNSSNKKILDSGKI